MIKVKDIICKFEAAESGHAVKYDIYKNGCWVKENLKVAEIVRDYGNEEVINIQLQDGNSVMLIIH